MALLKEQKVDRLVVKQYGSRLEMGKAVAEEAKGILANIIAEKGEVNIIFAAAPSQNEVLASLLECEEIDWSCVNAMHMDEYVGLPCGDEHSFARYLDDHIFGQRKMKSVEYIRGYASDPAEECRRYAEVLTQTPPDVVFLGIGENGHIAFNDPGVAKFGDPEVIKIAKLDEKCRTQQVNDGCFPSLDQVPTHALTLTIPTLMSAKHLFCAVPAATKAEAVRATVEGPVTEDCPATVMRNHPHATLYLDPDSGKLLS
ncbi:MAG: glucosamine-6-phosphate deaminase [Clostridia bacterium]|nr:glucosamine-6-phosphate deaminase [Clostridia bacterium]